MQSNIRLIGGRVHWVTLTIAVCARRGVTGLEVPVDSVWGEWAREVFALTPQHGFEESPVPFTVPVAWLSESFRGFRSPFSSSSKTVHWWETFFSFLAQPDGAELHDHSAEFRHLFHWSLCYHWGGLFRSHPIPYFWTIGASKCTMAHFYNSIPDSALESRDRFSWMNSSSEF